jgi:hypothetical protein
MFIFWVGLKWKTIFIHVSNIRINTVRIYFITVNLKISYLYKLDSVKIK